ncbi:MAG: AmmeMemoRadiSam system protein A [Gammaproteobacteria bacterium]|jgi:AmmeMemoRadiSam system protein A
MPYSPDEKSTLLSVALDSINNGLQHGKAARVNAADYPGPLSEQRASFVTLKHGNSLRGCIGTLEARTSLVESIADNAYAAAFSDPRFAALDASEVDDLTIEVSVLSPLVPVAVTSEQELLEKLIPGEAGWMLQDDGNRGTFLPAVWASLGEPADFLRQLKMKAGLAPDYWSNTLKIWKYTTESFAAPVAGIAASGQGTASAG